MGVKGSAYLTEEKREKIWKAIKEGVLFNDIADRFGVSNTTVGYVNKKMKEVKNADK